jgi:hypothetical protein
MPVTMLRYSQTCLTRVTKRSRDVSISSDLSETENPMIKRGCVWSGKCLLDREMGAILEHVWIPVQLCERLGMFSAVGREDTDLWTTQNVG